MRALWGGLLVVVLGCGSSTAPTGSASEGSPDSGTQNNGTPDSGSPPVTFALALNVVGNGEVDQGGQACTSACVRQVQAGGVHLHAAAAAGWNFDHWNLACFSADCDVTVGGDMAVTATFVQQKVDPPPHVTHALHVTVNGLGRVVSTPAAIDCPGICAATFDDGARVSLGESPNPGMLFSGFSGACVGAACQLTISSDANVSADFAVDDCVGLMPSRLPPPLVPVLDCQGGCDSGVSDDGGGNFMLHYTPGGANQAFAFFDTHNGPAAFVNTWFFGPGNLSGFSQPSGFTMVQDVNIAPNPHFINVWTVTASSAFENVVTLTNEGLTQAVVASDPLGGVVAVGTVPEGFGFTGTGWQRFTTTGAAATGLLIVASEKVAATTRAAGVTLSGASLLENQVQSPSGALSLERMWLDRNGLPLTPSFPSTQAPGDHSYQFLLDGGLVERDDGVFSQIWKEGSTKPSALPSWLAGRSRANWLFAIRGGAGYAMGGTCGGVEVLSTAGRSCGCLTVSGLSAKSSIGRDGSLIVPRLDHYELYPLLFH